jgi:DNA-binding MarR family transcriptional regulator
MTAKPKAGQSQLVEEIERDWKRERPELDLYDLMLAIYLMRLGRRIDHAYDRMCRERFGISGSDMRVLLALRRAGQPYSRRPTDLFRSTLVTSGAITKQVDRLSKLGFVKRSDNPSSGRGIVIQLTNKGLRTVNVATEMLANESVIAPATRSMSADQRAAARRIIGSLLAVCEDSTTQPQTRSGHKPPRKTRKRSKKG